MIYLASDDRYFTLGVTAMFSALQLPLMPIDINTDEKVLAIPDFRCGDRVIIAVECTGILTRLLAAARACGTPALLILDNTSEKTMSNISLWSQGVLSKKMPRETLTQFLNVGFAHLKDLSFLTAREINIMGSLATGKTPYKISKELNLSVKTISSHKLSALRKLGLNHLNSRSVLIFGKIFQGLSPA